MMNGNHLRRLVQLSIIGRALAQSSDVTTCLPEWQWSINSLNQTPCLVAAYLESSCSATRHDVNGIPAGNHYIGPISSDADLCSCNSVTYSLVEACGGCQGQGQTISYANWTIDCSVTVTIGQFPTTFPSQVEVPSWATLNISLTNDTFDAIAAEREAQRANASAFSTSPLPTPTGSQSTPPPETSSPSTSPDSSGLSSGGIAGVTIAALVAVILGLLILFWMRLRNRRLRNSKISPLNAPEALMHTKQDSASSPFFHDHSRSLSDPVSGISPYIYSNPSIGPRSPSPVASTLYTMAPANAMDEVTSLNSTVIPIPPTVQHPTTPQRPPGYTGAPEL